MPPANFRLRWESTGDQWWYASPIDCAAANGLYDVVLELLHQDPNLLLKLTSLRRIRRLETLWNDYDDDNNKSPIAVRRCYVARKLLLECESDGGKTNSLLRAGYGGWLLYTAASAGDLEFVKEMLDRDPLLVFGEGEYGVTDMFYAAARGRNHDVFRILFDFSMLPAGGIDEGGGAEDENDDDGRSRRKKLGVFRKEMMNRALHGAARGGHTELLKELIGESKDDIAAFRDVQGSTLLHSASATGQLEVVKHLMEGGYGTTMSVCKDSQGNTALHVAAYKAHLAVVETLLSLSPSLAAITNNLGYTFLHMAVAGFRTLGFRRLDRQIELMERLASGKIADLQDIVNAKNHNGRTALHMAVMDDLVSPDVAEMLLKIPSTDPNSQDSDRMTPLDVLMQRERSASSEVLIKRLVSAGGISKDKAFDASNHGYPRQKDQIFCGSPGTSFQISDSEVFLYTNSEDDQNAGPDAETFEENSICSTEGSGYSSNLSTSNRRKKSSRLNLNHAARRLKFLLRWTKRKDEEQGEFSGQLIIGDEDFEERHVPLRQMYSRTFCERSTSDLPSPSTRMKFTERLMQGVVFQAAPKFVLSPSNSFSVPSSPRKQDISTLASDQRSGRDLKRVSSANRKTSVNKFFCFGAQGLATEEDPSEIRSFKRKIRSFKRVSSLVA